MRGRSHSLLQEAGIDLAAILKEEGFYVPKRRLSSRLNKRLRGTFGTPNPVELPTLKELERTTDVYGPGDLGWGLGVGGARWLRRRGGGLKAGLALQLLTLVSNRTVIVALRDAIEGEF